ncbi:MAG: SDR family NAD(P)-dependent oxidoreductase [Myxococcota bacterium]|nr:SDR family NAD(P)-dependent oxidoreductase [Myxococcota bacterium]
MRARDARRLRERYGPWAVVTGASEGIGREMARTLAQAGVHLTLVARRRDALEALAEELSASHDVAVRVLEADLADLSAVDRVERETRDLDVGLLVACAGFGTSGPFLDRALEDELGQLDVNCRAVLAMSHAYGRRLRERGRGGIVLMSSLLAFQGVPNASHYAATKAWVQSLAEGLRGELRDCGVDVLASAPGPIHSGFASRAGMQMGMGQGPEVVALSTLRALGRRTTVRPGWLSKFLEASLKLPRPLRVRILTLVMGGMTAHQRG